MLVIWNERASPRLARLLAGSAGMSSPAKRVPPASGRRLPASCAISVVLPAPFGPMTACVSPSSTSSSMPALARKAPKLLYRACTSRRFLFIGTEKHSGEAALEKHHREHEQRPE